MAQTLDLRGARVLVVGAGIMGSGIAQVAAQSGHTVHLYDTRPGAADQACAAITKQWDALVTKGRLSAQAAEEACARLTAIDALEHAKDASLAIEAIVEDLTAKRALLARLEALLAPSAVLASNTSSISITAMARGLQRPERLVGMHFFNPVPLMKLVEVVSGLHSDHGVAHAIAALSRHWGKSPVRAQSTPGFIVNRIARPYYAEALALLHEQATSPAVLDAVLRATGFRMGPCELMDLIGHDTNFAVTQSVYEANFFDRRYAPSLVQRALVDGGLLGRKSGRGFYAYPAGTPAVPKPELQGLTATAPVVVHGKGHIAGMLWAAAHAVANDTERSPSHQRAEGSAWTGIAVGEARLVQTDGRCAFALAQEWRTPDVAVFDWLPPASGAVAPPSSSQMPEHHLAYSLAEQASTGWGAQAAAWLGALGVVPQLVADTPGLVVARTRSMLINEAADAVLQGVCSIEDANVAMELGVNYPGGPLRWLDNWPARDVLAVLDALDATYRGERYRASPWLRRKAAVAEPQQISAVHSR